MIETNTPIIFTSKDPFTRNKNEGESRKIKEQSEAIKEKVQTSKKKILLFAFAFLQCERSLRVIAMNFRTSSTQRTEGVVGVEGVVDGKPKITRLKREDHVHIPYIRTIIEVC